MVSHTGVPPFVTALRRLMADSTSASPGERCEICHAAVAAEHRHVVDISTRRVLCACQTCSSAEGRYRAVPRRYLRLPQAALSAAQWEALAIPVGLAFFFFNSHLGRIVACYPGAAGATESILPLDAWPAIAAGNPWIAGMVPDVEALLVRRVGDDYQVFIVPIDACYELVGRIRRTWTGFRGGDAAQLAIDQFFAAACERSAAGQVAGVDPHGDVEERM
jgi:hypothetical protein